MPEKCPDHNAGCESPQHEEHLCYFISQGFNLTEEKEYQWITSDPHFKCTHCGRVARCAKNLCKPIPL